MWSEFRIISFLSLFCGRWRTPCRVDFVDRGRMASSKLRVGGADALSVGSGVGEWHGYCRGSRD